jgi:hypothetical protein
MEIETQEIQDGKHEGEIVWVTHYNQPDLNKKALRSVPPTKCIIRSIDETDKRVYYSKMYFAPLNAKGETTKRVISPVDNTGYRRRCGNQLFVFTVEEEANIAWNEQVQAVIGELEHLAITASQKLINRANELVAKLKEKI